jgi:S-DNA-T family DNA segregation ATPase FtsK/SpoIIIE
VRILTPTQNKRLNELIGFVCLTLAILLALCLLSYSPHDASFNTAPSAPGVVAHNWIGPVGAFTSDVLFQLCGYAAFLFPVALFFFGYRWFRSHAIISATAKVCGSVMLFLFLPAELALLHFPYVRGELPAGGLMGSVVASGLRGALNPVGANVVGVACVLTALFLATRFSFSTAAGWLRKPLAAEGVFGRVTTRIKNWRDARESQRQRLRVQAIKIAGRKPVPAQSISKDLAVVGDEEDSEKSPRMKLELLDSRAGDRAESASDFDRDEDGESRSPAIIKFHEPEIAKPSKKASADPRITKGKAAFKLPSPTLLRPAEYGQKTDEAELKDYARAIEEKSKEFGVTGHITQINPGPVVTTFEFKPEAGIKYSRITGLADDLCLALRAESLLIERIPGKSTVGIEVPNPHRETIALREVVESPEFVHSPSKLCVPLGKDLIGRIRTADLTQMPHLLIAGSTGTGKSVFLNSLLIGLLLKSTPDELKLVLVDPKRLELGLYEDIPHLFTPVVTDPKVASNVLRNATREMERRLKLLAERGVRNIDQYNKTFQKTQSLSLFENADEGEHKPLPYLVIVIDELADLMMVDTSNVEESITRLAQMARAVGIHLILATQRPSVDVITGLIKANFPARISFRVASKVDSRTILDANGSESLLGKGDMLYLPAGSSRLHRIHGPYVTEDEIRDVCNFWREQAKAVYNEELLKPPKEGDGDSGEAGGEGGEDVSDELYQDAVRVVCEMGRASTSALQRRLRIGYGRAAHLIDIMEKDGIVGPADGAKAREVLKGKDWIREFDQSLH